MAAEKTNVYPLLPRAKMAHNEIIEMSDLIKICDVS